MNKLLSGLFIVFFISGCDSKNQDSLQLADSKSEITKHSSSINSDSANKLKNLQSQTGLELPDNTIIGFYESIEGSDQLIKCVLEMPNNDFEEWISTFSLEKTSFSEEKRYLLGQNENDWNPQSPKQLPTTQVQFENSKVMNIGYLAETTSKVKIYLVFHGN